ncbi:hypothetical protein [Cellulomonas oligotrophica]|uniref:Uncharacterized protein n=1 Tax=Cellulomonas oligotrophica TaxID=931536 RepID=A0A7Y9K044_9CELL|nr:hypothetical protein [Cellulomonas oligotrophica]NYD86945.1 hypothetical protein [Cellulomonas oligotrophica]
MNDADWFTLVLSLVLSAWAFEFIVSGAVRGVTNIPSDESFRRLSRGAWWLAPLFLSAAGACAASASLGRPVVAITLAAAAVAEAALCWRWRPSQADRFWTPVWMARLRSAVRIQIRDSAAWRRNSLGLVIGSIVIALCAIVLRG